MKQQPQETHRQHHLRLKLNPRKNCCSTLLAVAAAITLGTGYQARADLFVKTNNTDALNLASSWTNNAAPGAADIAQWDSTVADLNNTTNTLGAATSWGGIKVLNPAGPITIAGDGNTLTLGASGIDMSAASASLTLSNNVALQANSVQTWTIASGQALTLGGTYTRPAGTGLHFDTTAGGTINLAGATASSVLPYSDINGTDVGAVDASKNVTGAGSVITYTQNTDANPPNIGSFTYLDVLYGSAAANYGVRLTSSSTTPVIVRFNAHQQYRSDWTYDVNTRVNYVSSPSSIYLVTTNVGAQDVIITGTNHAFRWNSGTELVLDQENPAGTFYVNGATSQRVATLANTLTKYGPGRVVFNAWPANNGPARILGGELMMNGHTTPTSVVFVENGGILSGTGVISGAATNFSGGTIWAGNNGAGTLTVTNLTLNDGSGLKFYSSSLSTTNTTAMLNLPGALAVNGNVNVFIDAGSPVVGQYPLIQWTNPFDAGTFASFNLNLLSLRTTGYLSNNVANDSIDLVVTNVDEPVKWTAGDGTWDVYGAANWLDTLGASTTYQETNGLGDTVLFDDSAAGTSPITVTLNTTVSPGGATFNASKDFIISGNGDINGGGSLTKTGSGALLLETTNGFTGGININDGIVNFTTISNLGSGAISFGGGTLQYSNNTDDLSLHTVTFNSGVGTIDIGAQTLNFANPVGNGGAGGFTKAGTGTLTLNGTNVYSGNTVISSGTLALGFNTYITNSAAIIVGNGAVLDAATSGVNLDLNSSAGQVLAGVGTVNGTVTAEAGTTISPATNGVAGTLNLGNDLIINGGRLAFDVSTTNSDFITVGGNLTINAGSLLVLTNSTPLTNGVYKLIQYAGALLSGAGSAGNLTISGFSQAGKSPTLSDATAGEIDLIVGDSASDHLSWSGAGASWDLAGTVDWLNGATAWIYTNGDFVTFDDSATGSSTVNLMTALLPGSVTVSNNVVSPYTFADGTGTGGGKIAGSTALMKDGPGTLIVQTANTYTGPTTIKNGTLQIGNGGIGDIGKGNVTNNGVLVFNQADANIHTVAGQISGTGSLTQQGSATVVLAQNNSYSGPTTISSGALQVGNGGATGSLGANSVTNNGTLIFNQSGTVSVPNNISGSGVLNMIGTSTTTFGGSLTYQGNTYLSNGVVKLTANNQIPDANSVSGSTGWLILDGGASTAGKFDLAGFDETINALSGVAGTVNGVITNSGASTNTLTIMNSAVTTYNGILTGKIKVTLTGANELRLNGASTYVGGTFVGGTATLGVGPGSAVGTGGIVLSNGTTYFMHNNGSTSVFPGDNITIPDGATATFNSGSLANGYGGNLSGGPTSTNVIAGAMSFGVGNAEQYSNFPGTVLISPAGTLRFSSTGLTLNGGDNTTFDIEGTGVLQTRNAGTVHLGALTGDGNITSPQANSGTGVFQIGYNNADSAFSGSITGTNSLVKVGTGTLTLDGATGLSVTSPDGGLTFVTNSVYLNTLINYVGATTISNGVLKLVAPVVLTNWPTPITLASATAVLDASEMGYINTDNSTFTNLVTNGVFEVISGQALAGIGTIRASNVVVDAGSILNVGLPTGVLTATNNMELAGTVNMNLNLTNSPNASELVARNFTIDPTAMLVVTNLGAENAATFHLFSGPVNFASVTLPALSGTNSWTDNLAVDGSITLVAPPLVNTSVTSISNTFDGSNLTLTWPQDHTGWHLQVQTNLLAAGLGTNWVDVTGSDTTNMVVIPVNPSNGAVFYRLVYP